MSDFQLKPIDLLKSLNWRYAVKKFDSSKKLNIDIWKVLEESLRLTPSSYGLQTWKFLVIENPDLKKQLRGASWGQSQVEECSHYIVLCARKTIDENYIRHCAKVMSEVRNVEVASLDKLVSGVMNDVVKGPRAQVAAEWMARQCYIALGNLMTCASLLGVDACPMEGLDPIRYDEILGLGKSDYRTIVACAIGYRHIDDKYQSVKKFRFASNELFEYR